MKHRICLIYFMNRQLTPCKIYSSISFAAAKLISCIEHDMQDVTSNAARMFYNDKVQRQNSSLYIYFANVHSSKLRISIIHCPQIAGQTTVS